MRYKIGDKLKLLTDFYEDETYSQNVSKGSVLDVVQSCRTRGQWIDQTSVELDFLYPPYNHDNEFELVEEEKVKNRFTVGDKVISIIDVTGVPEGYIGHVVKIRDKLSFPIVVRKEGTDDERVFNEDELELLSVGKKEKFQQLKEEARIIFDGLVDKDHPFNRDDITPQDIAGVSKAEYTGGSSSYYKVDVTHPTTSEAPYQAECNDVIEALGLTFTEGNIFKAIWRIAADRQGKKKKGNNSVYDAEKVVFFAERLLIQEKSKEGK